jgi:hypothetical protein
MQYDHLSRIGGHIWGIFPITLSWLMVMWRNDIVGRCCMYMDFDVDTVAHLANL